LPLRTIDVVGLLVAIGALVVLGVLTGRELAGRRL
jgi:hypothetical protein